MSPPIKHDIPQTTVSEKLVGLAVLGGFVVLIGGMVTWASGAWMPLSSGLCDQPAALAVGKSMREDPTKWSISDNRRFVTHTLGTAVYLGTSVRFTTIGLNEYGATIAPEDQLTGACKGYLHKAARPFVKRFDPFPPQTQDAIVATMQLSAWQDAQAGSKPWVIKVPKGLDAKGIAQHIAEERYLRGDAGPLTLKKDR